MIDFAQDSLYNPGVNSFDYEGVHLNPEGSRIRDIPIVHVE